MSEQRVGPYTDDQIETLRSLYSNEKVAYLLSVQPQGEEEDLLGGEGEDPYAGLKVDQLVEILRERDLPTEGRKAELLERLRESDSKTE